MEAIFGFSLSTQWAPFIGRFKTVATILNQISKKSHANWVDNKHRIAKACRPICVYVKNCSKDTLGALPVFEFAWYSFDIYSSEHFENLIEFLETNRLWIREI